MKRPCIIGTAGHIDHGKTQLIRLLTGVDTDRLKDEKKRGISIELGFASLTTPSGIRCGVIDVPGHERFVRNMLAGAGGIDVILLVVAADEGIMPQTREHLDIVGLLGAESGVVAVTKIDLVEEDWRELVLEEVREYLQATCLANAPIQPVSGITGEGKEALLSALDEAVMGADLSPRGKFTRLPIDRVFTMQGFGTVVTGTLWAGSLHEGDKMAIAPAGHETRIRTLEVHNQRVAEALAGQRVAVSLHAIERGKIARGDWLVTPNPPPTTQLLQARMRCVRNSPYPVKNRMRVRFHLGASEIMGRIIPLEADEMKPGEEGFVQIRLDAPILAERGDRFVLRSYSPMRTLGGGLIVDVSGVRRRRFRDEDLRALTLAEEGSLEERVYGAIASTSSLGVAENQLPSRIGQPPEEVAGAVSGLIENRRVERVGKQTLFSVEALEETGRRIIAILTEHQKEHPLRWGLSKSELKSRLDKKVHPELIERWIKNRVGSGDLYVRDDRLRYGENRITLSPSQETIRKKILTYLDERGYAGPSTKELLEEIGRPETEELLAHLLREEEIIRIPPDLVLSGGRISEMRSLLQEFFTANEAMGVAALKEILGVSRKQAVPLLEWLDRNRWTQRQGDIRVEGPRLRDGTD